MMLEIGSALVYTFDLHQDNIRTQLLVTSSCNILAQTLGVCCQKKKKKVTLFSVFYTLLTKCIKQTLKAQIYSWVVREQPAKMFGRAMVTLSER